MGEPAGPAGREGARYRGSGWAKVRRAAWAIVQERRERRKALNLLGVQLGAPPSLPPGGMLVLPFPPPPASPGPLTWGQSRPVKAHRTAVDRAMAAHAVLRSATSAAGRSARPRRGPRPPAGDTRTRSGPGPARRRPDGTPGGRGPPELTPGAGPGPADLHERDMGDLKKAIRSSRGVIFPDSKFRTM